MGERKNLAREGTLEKRGGVCPSRTPFSLSLITSKCLLRRVKKVVRKCGAINHENRILECKTNYAKFRERFCFLSDALRRQYQKILLNSSWVNDHSWLRKPFWESPILYIKKLCLASRLRGTKHFSRSISFAFSLSLKPKNFNARKLAWTHIFPVHYRAESEKHPSTLSSKIVEFVSFYWLVGLTGASSCSAELMKQVVSTLKIQLTVNLFLCFLSSCLYTYVQ